MLQNHERPRGIASRVKGQQALRARLARRIKALTGDLIAVQRFIQLRAQTEDAQNRAATAAVEIEVARRAALAAHDALDAHEPAYPRNPVRKRPLELVK